MPDPFQTQCCNAHRDDYWTCPGCYHDLGNVGRGTHTCPECGRLLHCTVEYEPACYTRLAEEDQDDA